MRRNVISEWRGAATKKHPAGAADPRRRAQLQRRGMRSFRPTVPVASKGPLCRACLPHSRANLATYHHQVAFSMHAARHNRAPCLDATHGSLFIAWGMREARPRTYGSRHRVRCAIVAGGPPVHSDRRLPARSSSSRNLLQTARTPPPLPSLPLSHLVCASPAARSPHPAAACGPLSFSAAGCMVVAGRHELRRQRCSRHAAAHDRHSDRARSTAQRVYVHSHLRGRTHAHTRRAVLRLGEQRS